MAVKELKIGSIGAKERSKINNEIKILKTLKHTNIIELYDVVETSNMVCIVMEYCQGGDLREYLGKRKRLDEYEVQDIVYQVAQGLTELYRKDIIHRDIKLQNLLRRTDESPTVVKIADFGLARYAPAYASTVCGTLPYMAPEILKR